MVKIDRGSGDSSFVGTALVQVVKVEQKASKKPPHHKFFIITLASVETGEEIGTDLLMLGGKGVWMTIAKLTAFGFPEEVDDIDPAQFKGRKVYAAFKSEIDSYSGFPRSVVDINAQGSRRGYWPEDAPPEGVASQASNMSFTESDPFAAEDTPF